MGATMRVPTTCTAAAFVAWPQLLLVAELCCSRLPALLLPLLLLPVLLLLVVEEGLEEDAPEELSFAAMARPSQPGAGKLRSMSHSSILQVVEPNTRKPPPAGVSVTPEATGPTTEMLLPHTCACEQTAHRSGKTNNKKMRSAFMWL